jgi:hypothetical protein
MADDADALLKGMLGIKNVVEGTKRDRCVGNFFVFWGVSRDGSGDEGAGESEGKERYAVSLFVFEWQENLPWRFRLTKFRDNALLR